MCGITGAAWTDPRGAIDTETLARMTEVITHRGPDDAGTYTSELRQQPGFADRPGVALGFRRLSIIDLAGGHQPLSNEDGSVWVVFNGEIYNDPDLRRRLEGAGHQYRTYCDTESLVHLYEDEGENFLKHLVGMFGLCIWDSRKNTVLLARDRLGQKPVYYYHEPGRLIFGSELKSLLQVPDMPKELDPQAVDEYLTYRYVPHPHTILKGVKKLPPGHYAVFKDGQLSVRPYWEPDWNAETSLTMPEASERLRELMEEAVRIRLRSDVPLGAFLSGGIDSSITVSLAQGMLNRKLKTFSMGFSEAAWDETSYAQEVATKLGTEHYELRIDHTGADILDKLAFHYDEPYADSSAIPTWHLSEFTRRQVTVAVSGDGGDELFAGYPHHFAAQIASFFDKLPGPLRKAITLRLWQRMPGGNKNRGVIRKFKRLTQALSLPPAARQVRWMCVFGESQRAALYSDDFIATLPDADPVDHIASMMAQMSKRDAVTQSSLADLMTYLPGDLMTKVDIASMAHSLEVRSPFLDHRVVEFAISLPVSLKLKRGVGKMILRDAFGDLIPQSVLTRKKQGFGVPLEPWFRGPLKHMVTDLLLDSQTLGRGMFKPEAVQQLIDDHMESRQDTSSQLWALMNLELWQRQWLDGAVTSSATPAAVSTSE